MQGILGGTFDPPHNAHLAMAEAAFIQLGLDIVRLMPAGDPWQKHDTGVSDPIHRYSMAELLASDAPYLVVDDTEIKRTGPSYTIETLEELEEKPTLILGADAALGIPTWHRADELASLAEIAVAPRTGIGREDVDAAIGADVVWLDMQPIEISSTMVRQVARSGGSISDLVPASIEAYIRTSELYGTGKNRRAGSLSSSPMKKQSHTAAPEAVDLAKAAGAALDAKSGEDVMILDLSDLLVVTDVFVLATGTSRRNVLTLADEVVAALRTHDRTPIRKEGTDHGKWVLLDYGDVVVHVFDRQTREYYDLERLWAGAPRIDLEPSSSTASA